MNTTFRLKLFAIFGATLLALVSVLETMRGWVKSLPGGKLLPTHTNEDVLVVGEMVPTPNTLCASPLTVRFSSMTTVKLDTGLPSGSLHTSLMRRG